MGLPAVERNLIAAVQQKIGVQSREAYEIETENLHSGKPLRRLGGIPRLRV